MAVGADFRSRIQLDGGDQAVADLKKFGRAGEQAFSDVAKGARGATVALEEVTGATSTAARSFTGLGGSFSGLSAAFSGIVSRIGGLKTALTGLAAIEGVRQAAGAIGDVASQLSELKNVSVTTGITTDNLRALQIAMGLAGGQVEKVGGMMIQFAGAVGQAQAQTKQLGNSLFPTINVLKGTEGAVQGLAGGVEKATDGMGKMVGAATAVGKKLPKVFAGGEERGVAAAGAADPFKMLEINANNYGKSISEINRLLKDAIAQFTKISKIDPGRAARAGALLFGEDDITKVGAAFELINKVGLDQFVAKLRELGRLPTLEDFGRVEEYNKAWGELNTTFASFKMEAVIGLFPSISATLKSTQTDLNNLNALWQASLPVMESAWSSFVTDLNTVWQAALPTLKEAWGLFLVDWNETWTQAKALWVASLPIMKDAWAAFITDLDELWKAENWTNLWDDFSKGFLTAAENIGVWFGGLLERLGNQISEWASTAWDKIKAVGSAAGSALGSMARPFAAGGMVPGSGGGDIVPAMLTPGEFVIRKSIVDSLGAGFFAALNGGMGSFLPRGRYATGGLVAGAAGGTPVHLHLGNQSFALSGSANVVSALVVEAHRQHIRSAGLKPSWYGGR